MASAFSLSTHMPDRKRGGGRLQMAPHSAYENSVIQPSLLVDLFLFATRSTAMARQYRRLWKVKCHSLLPTMHPAFFAAVFTTWGPLTVDLNNRRWCVEPCFNGGRIEAWKQEFLKIIFKLLSHLWGLIHGICTQWNLGLNPLLQLP